MGAIPVTSVVTELVYRDTAQATIYFGDGREEIAPLSSLAAFISDKENPENRKGISRVVIGVPELKQFKGLRFIDTPGLESTSVRNSETSLEWAPNLDLAIVAVGVDPPLTGHDLELIRKLFEYTPRVCILLTKVDLLAAEQLAEVHDFVRGQIAQGLGEAVAVFPYSTRPGSEHWKNELQRDLINPALASLAQEQEAIRWHKVRALVRECGDYLGIIRQSAEKTNTEERELQMRALAGREMLADTLLQLRLAAHHQIGLARSHMEAVLAPYEKKITPDLRRIFAEEFARWRLALAPLMDRFQEWLQEELRGRLQNASKSNQEAFLQPVRDAERQCRRVLEGFRDRLSMRALELFGLPLRTTELEIVLEPPKKPDMKLGHIFDHNWEIISPLIPMALVRSSVEQRFLEKVEYETYKNLSRLATQWSDIAEEMIRSMEKEAARRLQQLVQTVEQMGAPSQATLAAIEADMRALRQLQEEKKEEDEVYEH